MDLFEVGLSVLVLVRPAALFARLHEAVPYRLLHERLAADAPLGDGARVLDLGCGPGGLTSALVSRGFEAIGLDRSEAMLRAARRRRPEVRFVAGDATATGFPAASFDGVVCASLLNVVSDPGAVVREARRLLVDGGRLGVLLPGPAFAGLPASGRVDAALMGLWAKRARTVPAEVASEWLRAEGFGDLRVTDHHGVYVLWGTAPSARSGT